MTFIPIFKTFIPNRHLFLKDIYSYQTFIPNDIYSYWTFIPNFISNLQIAAGHICANFAICSWELLIMLNPHFVAGEHGLFGGHKSEDIRTFFIENT